ncbi:porin [Bradyrhizobium retamae]|uniref:porin n=1 Tax=Bradyrhizobium retamae TaxID=1300035 RepID=UPI000B2D2801
MRLARTTCAYGAQTADAIAATELEPVVYVGVCDAYGAGVLHISGKRALLEDAKKRVSGIPRNLRRFKHERAYYPKPAEFYDIERQT